MAKTVQEGHGGREAGSVDGRGGAPDRPAASLAGRASFWRSFGPGLLWAAAAIGVSHLVQSTRAGADAGFSLAWLVLAALALKYPFFEYGPRYAAATGESLVEGYRRLGRWGLWLYLLVTLATALIVQVTVVLLTAFLFAHVLGVGWAPALSGGIVLALCGALLWVGRFRALDLTIKAVLVVLAISTLVAAAVVIPRAGGATAAPWPMPTGGGAISFAFVLALVGWMPSAIDISVWSSLWTLAKDRTSGVRADPGAALLDFRIGYVGTGIVAFAFLTLGAGVMQASGQTFSSAGTEFSLQLVDLYAETLGAWSRPVVLLAVVTTMFSTTLTVMDGFPRAIARSIHTLRHGLPEGEEKAARDLPEGKAALGLSEGKGEARLGADGGSGAGYWVALLVLAVLTVVVLGWFTGSLTGMVDFATTVAFVTAPILGYLNLRAVTAPHVPAAYRPGPALRAFSYLGLVLLGGTAVVYLVVLVV